MAIRPTTRAALFLAGGILVAAVLALLYFSEPQRGTIPEMPATAEDDPHTEIQWLEAMWEEHPTHAPIALQLGNLHAQEGNHATAVKYYREFLKLDTSATGWQVRLDIAKALHAMGQPGAARGEVAWILERDPNHAGALYNMGAIEANAGNNAAARRHWIRLIGQHPQDSLAQFAREAMKLLK